jgi:hypothetical protein
MIIEIAPELLVEMFRTDHLARHVVIDGIPRDHYLVEARVNMSGIIELVCVNSDTDESLERKAVTLTDLRGT